MMALQSSYVWHIWPHYSSDLWCYLDTSKRPKLTRSLIGWSKGHDPILWNGWTYLASTTLQHLVGRSLSLHCKEQFKVFNCKVAPQYRKGNFKQVSRFPWNVRHVGTALARDSSAGRYWLGQHPCEQHPPPLLGNLHSLDRSINALDTSE